METVGGAISGYSAIGSVRITTAPAIVSSTESTVAKIGRSMKKWAKRNMEAVLSGKGGRGADGAPVVMAA